MQLKLNGAPQETAAETVAALIEELGLDPSALVVEHNREVVRQADWAAAQLSEGDELELLSFVGGG